MQLRIKSEGTNEDATEDDDETTEEDDGDIDDEDDTIDDEDTKALVQPFTSLNFYGEHKKAISSLSFAPSTHLSRRGSFNSSGSGNLPVFVASSSADGIGKLHDITKYVDGTDETIGPIKKKPGPPERPGPNVSTPGGTVGPAMTTKLEPIHNLFGE